MYDLEFYYWCGFLLGDGYFNFEKERIVLALSSMDEDHLTLFKNFFSASDIYRYKITTKKGKICDISRSELRKGLNIFHPIVSILGIKSRKTYEAPEWFNLEDDKIMALIIGLIDADGYIKQQSNRTDCFISIQMHKNWNNFLTNMLDFLLKKIEIKSNAKTIMIKNKDAARLNIANVKILKYLYEFAIDNKLPYMKRKWGKIDLNRKTRLDKVLEKSNLVKKLSNDGMTYREISEHTGINMNSIGYLKRRVSDAG